MKKASAAKAVLFDTFNWYYSVKLYMGNKHKCRKERNVAQWAAAAGAAWRAVMTSPRICLLCTFVTSTSIERGPSGRKRKAGISIRFGTKRGR